MKDVHGLAVINEEKTQKTIESDLEEININEIYKEEFNKI